MTADFMGVFDGDDFRDREPSDVQGKEGLEWIDCGTAGYKLYDGRGLHKCKSAARADEFKVVG